MRIALLAIGLLACAFPARAQAPTPETMLVLDASNSMWGRVDSQPKIAVARDAVGALVRSLPPGTRMGLMAYGHRRAGDCRDIEVLLRPGPVDPVAFDRAASLSPRGRTPIAEAITQASGVAHRVVLVSDGVETCLPDPCGAIRALKLRVPRLQVHIIGFDLPLARDQAQLRCIAEATGGRFVAAGSAAELGRALAGVAVVVPPPPPPVTPPGLPVMTNLTLEAVEAEGGYPVQVGDWTLLTTGNPQRLLLSGNAQSRPTLRVPVGRYEVRARLGTMRVVERFDAEAPQTTQRVVLNPGTLRAVGAMAADAPPRGGTWTVWADEVAGFRSGETVLTSAVAQPVMRLVQGSYRVRFRAGEASAETVVFVEAGETQVARVNLDAGELVLAVRRDGQPVQAQLWEFVRLGQSVPHTSFSDVRPRVLLPAGEWLVRARVENAWHELRVTLEPGQVTEVAIPLT